MLDQTKLGRSCATWCFAATVMFTVACGSEHGHGTPLPGDGGAIDASVAVEPGAPATVAPDHDGGAPGPAQPLPATGNPPCVFSADCPSGQYCDLGECFQQCSAARDCDAGKTCSSRGRCLAPGEIDADPTVTERLGTVRAEPSASVLTERDDRLRIRLVADTRDPVRYRVETHASYLAVNQARGEFEGGTTLEIRVDPTALRDYDTTGSVRIVTTLGELTIDVPIQIGPSGRYDGNLVYDGVAGVPLGTSHAVFDLLERNGDVTVRIDPERSLLFPDVEKGHAMSGRGAFTPASGADLSLKQRVPAGFAGDEDPFQRPIGRTLRFHLDAAAAGVLDGTFEETLYGLFEQPVTLTGHAHFSRQACGSDGDCTPVLPPLGTDPEMPTTAMDLASVPDVGSVFTGWTPDACVRQAFARASTCNSPSECAAVLDETFHQPFVDLLNGTGALTSSAPLADLSSTCLWNLAASVPLDPVSCAQIVPLACELSLIDAVGAGTDAHDAFAMLYAHTIDPALFVAQDRIVLGLKRSFQDGLQAESEELRRARAVLSPSLRWVLQPRLLEYLRRLRVSKPESGEPVQHVAARTLARSFVALSQIDGELTRISTADPVADIADQRHSAQQRGFVALLEAATLAGIANTWSSVPDELATGLTDVLTPIDRGFGDLNQGSLIFGVTEGVIPNVFEPGRKPTNFEQLLDMAAARITSLGTDEEAFTHADRSFEEDDEHLETELQGVAASYDDRIAAICGASFDLEKADWSTCGSGHTGTLGASGLAIAQANERLHAAQSALTGKKTQIDIQRERIAAIQDVRRAAIEFTKSNGEKLEALVEEEGFIEGAEKVIDIASRAEFWNGGAPLAEAPAMALLEAQRTSLNEDRQRLQTMQEVRTQQDGMQVEAIEAAALIKSMLVDMAQQQVEMRQDLLGVLQARVDAENALAEAKRAYADRSRALTQIGRSPRRDPTFRLLRSRAAMNALGSRADAQRALFLAGRGLEYHLNRPIGDALGQAVANVYDHGEAVRLQQCLQSVFDQSQLMPKAQAYTTDVSVRKLLGVAGPRLDEVTRRTLTEGEQFRHLLLENENLDGEGGVGIELSSTLDPGNLLWSSNVCDDRITSVEAQLVGDFLGDDEAEVYLDLPGGGVLRQCDGDGLRNWSTSGHAVIQAGVNTWGTAPPNASLVSLPVASSKWRVKIPGPSAAPSNADLRLEQLEDIVLRVHHVARPISASPDPVSFACLATVGTGG